MRFIVMAMTTNESKMAAAPPAMEAFVAMQEYNEKAVKAGILLAAEGLNPTSKGARAQFTGDQPVIIDGPFAEAKEVVVGFCIIKVNSMAEAIEWVKRAPQGSSDGNTLVEIRKLMDIDDFGEGFTPNEEIAKVKF